MLINVSFERGIETFELDDSGTFENLYKDIVDKYGLGILRGPSRDYLEHDVVAESDLAYGDDLIYEPINFQNCYKLGCVPVLKWKDEEYSVWNTFDVSFDSILHSFMFGREKHFSDATPVMRIFPFPDHFLPVLKSKSDLPTYRFDKKYKTHGLGFTNVLKHKFSFNYLDKEIEKSEKFYHNMTKRYELSTRNRVIEFVSSKLKSTKSVISGSFILYDLNLIPEFDDIDVFSESLDLLVDLIHFGGTLQPMNPCFKSSFLSYKLSFDVDNKYFVVNFIHVNCDGHLTNDIANSSQERVLKFISQRFDLSCCITAFDGDTLHYHDSLYSRVFDVCGKTTDDHVANRIIKYSRRGFEIGDIKHTETCQRLYSDAPMKTSKTQGREADTMLIVARNGNVRLLKEIVKHVDVDLFTKKAIDRFAYRLYNAENTYIISKALGHRFYRNHWYYITCGAVSNKENFKRIFALMSDKMAKDVVSKAINRRNCKFLFSVFKNLDIEIPRKKFTHEYCCREFRCSVYEGIMADDSSVELSDCEFSRNFL